MFGCKLFSRAPGHPLEGSSLNVLGWIVVIYAASIWTNKFISCTAVGSLMLPTADWIAIAVVTICIIRKIMVPKCHLLFGIFPPPVTQCLHCPLDAICSTPKRDHVIEVFPSRCFRVDLGYGTKLREGCKNLCRVSVISWLNRSVPSVVVTIDSALVLYQLSGMYCKQVFKHSLSTPRMASAVAGSMMCRLPIPRHQNPFLAVRYFHLDVRYYQLSHHPLSAGWCRAYNCPHHDCHPCPCHPPPRLSPPPAVSPSAAAATPSPALCCSQYHRW